VRIPDVTDAELAALAGAGDGDAFGTLVERYAPAVRRVTRALLRDPEDADDATQEGFLSAWRHIGRYDPARPFGPWLMRIALNAAQDLRRRRRVRQTDPIPYDARSADEGPDLATERALLRERLDRALSALPPRQRIAVVLFDAEGYSHAEVAEVLGIPEGTVRSDVFHGRRALRAHLTPASDEVS
jgi:RNA polymerase sigma-70 factor (ECF subfamily)